MDNDTPSKGTGKNDFRATAYFADSQYPSAYLVLFCVNHEDKLINAKVKEQMFFIYFL